MNNNWKIEFDKVCNNNSLLVDVIDNAVDGLLITDPKFRDNPIVYASTGFSKLTGYNIDEILGKNCRFLQGPGSEKHIIEIISRSVKQGQSFKGVITNYKSDSTPFMNLIRIKPYYIKNQLEYFIGSQVDVTHLV